MTVINQRISAQNHFAVTSKGAERQIIQPHYSPPPLTHIFLSFFDLFYGVKWEEKSIRELEKGEWSNSLLFHNMQRMEMREGEVGGIRKKNWGKRNWRKGN